MKKLLITILSIIMLVSMAACGSETTDDVDRDILESTQDADESDIPEATLTTEPTHIPQLDMPDMPDEAYIISCLKKVPNIKGIAAVTADNDPNDGLSKEDGYYAAVFFSVDLLPGMSELTGDALIEEATSAGGCIEAYRTVEDAEARAKYLKKFSYVGLTGYDFVYETLVIRLANKLSDAEQENMEANIITALEGGVVNATIGFVDEKALKEWAKALVPEDMNGFLFGIEVSSAIDDYFEENESKILSGELDEEAAKKDLEALVIGMLPTPTPSPTPKPTPVTTNMPVPTNTPTPEPTVPIVDRNNTTLTVSNCSDLKKLLKVEHYTDAYVGEFAEEYAQKTIAFDGYIEYMFNMAGVDNHYDIFIRTTEVIKNEDTGPMFMLDGVDVTKIDIIGTEKLSSKMRVYVVAKVLEYDESWTAILLEPISMEYEGKVEATPTPTSEPEDNTVYVWVSTYGKKYHSNPECSDMKKPSQITLEKAKASGRQACENCWVNVEDSAELKSDALTVANSLCKEYIDANRIWLKSWLMEVEGFSETVADYAVENCNADWYTQALFTANEYSDSTGWTPDDIREILEEQGFTSEEIDYALEKCDID